MTEFSLAVLQKLWPHGNQHIPGLVEGIATAAPVVFPKYGTTKPLVIAHMMAQFSEECGAGLEMIENMNYSAEGLERTFPTHFRGSMPEHYAHNPRMIADVAYGGRMGNAPPPSNDGWVYRGAGLSQVTGKSGVEILQKELDAHKAGFNVVENPEIIVDPKYTLECGVADYIACGCLPHAEKDDIIGETRALNGGLNGLSVREHWLALWKRELL